MTIIVENMAPGRQAWCWGSSWEFRLWVRFKYEAERALWELPEIWKPQSPRPVTHLLQQGYPSFSFLNISTNWEPIIQIHEPMGAMLVRTTSNTRVSAILSFTKSLLTVDHSWKAVFVFHSCWRYHFPLLQDALGLMIHNSVWNQKPKDTM